ncbi:cytochrome b-c1 complex, subunit 6, partial [Cynara cardunculus var. scolymus]
MGVRDRRFVSSRSDEEPVDQKRHFEDLCKPKCVRAWLDYQGCVKRVEADETGHKHCTGQYFDYWQCVDKCVRLFSCILLFCSHDSNPISFEACMTAGCTYAVCKTEVIYGRDFLTIIYGDDNSLV